MKLISPNVPIQIMTPDGQIIEIDAIDYAIGKNANLGINEAGKTYAAGYMAEQLMKRGIPIVVISPSPGRPWRYLKIPKPGKEGFPVVVVGDNADLPLDPERVGEIMLAAMQERISIVFDIHSSKLSEAARRKITTAIVDTMYWKNQDYGLRHCFLEEAANYAPQNLHDKITYGAVERFTREGGNAKVGVTLLNPRAESVNKNLLELCSSLFLFQQTGKNSVANLKKFFEQIDTSNRSEIIKSFPRLIRGRAWYWKATNALPIEIQFPEKDTEHPNRRALAMDVDVPLDKAVDVSAFVARMTRTLEKQTPKKEEVTETKVFQGKSTRELANEDLKKTLFEAQQRIVELEQQYKLSQEDLRSANRRVTERDVQLETVREMLKPDYERMQKIFGELVSANGAEPASSVDSSRYARWFPQLIGYQKDMLQAFIDHRRLTREKLGLMIGKTVKGNGTFGDYITALKKKGLIREEGDELVLVDL